MRPWRFVLAITAITLVAVGAAVAYVLTADDTVGIHGLIAMVLGIAMAFAVGGGLMFLVFLSARRGHDDAG